MKTDVVTQPTLLSKCWPRAYSSTTRLLLLVILGSGLLTLSAKVTIPFYPVPMTMQTFTILVIGLAFGWKLATATVLLYLFEGAVGFPVFAGTPAKGLGITYMMGPTGGYLLGFLLSASLLGYLGERGFDRNVLLTTFAMLLGLVVIFGFGYAWLAHLIGMERAFQYGVQPFLLAELLKVILAAFVLPFCWKVLGRIS